MELLDVDRLVKQELKPAIKAIVAKIGIIVPDHELENSIATAYHMLYGQECITNGIWTLMASYPISQVIPHLGGTSPVMAGIAELFGVTEQHYTAVNEAVRNGSLRTVVSLSFRPLRMIGVRYTSFRHIAYWDESTQLLMPSYAHTPKDKHHLAHPGTRDEIK